MRRSISTFTGWLFSAATLATLFVSPVNADSVAANQEALAPEPWEKLSVSLGAFYSNTETGVRVGSGLGLDLDLENFLGLEAQTMVFRADAAWRFTRNRRHRLDASWFALRRTANRHVGDDFDIKDREGNTITIAAGSDVATRFDLDIIEGAYSYSFLQDDRVDLAVVGGLYVMPLSLGIEATGLTAAKGSFNFTAPLPVVGLRMDVALTPKWFLRSGYQFLYVEYENFTGQLSQLRTAIEFLPLKHFGVGLGIDSMKLGLEAKDDSYANVDLRGNVDFQYTGLQLYGKLRF